MNEKIGILIKKVADSQGLSQSQLGEKINRTKQGVAGIYKRSTIDTELLKDICIALNYDFFAHYYEDGPLLQFKQKSDAVWQDKINLLVERLESNEKLLKSNEEVIILQRKYISKLEEGGEM